MKRQVREITPKQLAVLNQIAMFESRQCYSATIGELAHQLGVSRPTAFEHIAALRKKGLITKSKGKARCLRLTLSGNQLLEFHKQQSIENDSGFGGYPLLGRVAAGLPTEAIEDVDYISLAEVFGNDSQTFVLQVEGESMINDGIFPGDYAICKKTSHAKNGQLVIAIVDDNDATLKRFYRHDDHVRLQPANDAFEPIITTNCRIEAVIEGILRRF